MKILLRALVVLPVVLLWGCGGGGGSNRVSDEEVASHGSRAVAALVDNVPQLAYLIASAAENIPVPKSYPITAACINDDGMVSYAHDDVDNDGTLNTGDRYDVIFESCVVGMLNDSKISGVLRTEVNHAVDSSESDYYDLTANFSGISYLYDSSQPEATTLRITYSQSSTIDRMVVSSNEEVFGFTYSTHRGYSFRDFRVERIIDRRTAEWEVRAEGYATTSDISKEFKLHTGSYLSGTLLQYPAKGSLQYSSGNAEFHAVVDDSDLPSAYAKLVYPDGTAASTAVIAWGNLMPGFYAWSPYVNWDTSVYSNNNFSLLYTAPFPIGKSESISISPAHQLTVQLNRYINDVDVNALMYLPSNQSLPSIEAAVSTDGTLLMIGPVQQLKHGEFYELAGDLTIYDSGGNVVEFPGYQFKTRASVEAAIDQFIPYAISAQPLVLYGNSSTAEAGIATVNWIQSEGPLAPISNPTSLIATIDPPTVDIPELLEFTLEVTDTKGEYDKESVSVAVFRDASEVAMLYVNRDVYISEITHPQETYLVSTADYSLDTTVLSDESMRLQFSASGKRSWVIRVAAPDNQRLKPGIYTGAQQFNTDDLSRPIFWLSGDAPDCNQSTDFEVLGVSYTETGELQSLSLDFTQNCGQGTPVTGAIRLGVAP